MKLLLPRVRQYFRTNLHTHTNITDASPTPEQMKEFYKKRGYQILCISDHNVIIDFSEMNEDGFLMLTGAEFNVNEENYQRGNSKSAHFNFIAKRPDNLWQPFRYHKEWNSAAYLAKADIDNMSQEHSAEAINAFIAEANKRGFLVMYNHPHWSLHSYEDYSKYKGLWAMELRNTGSAPYGDHDSGTVYRDLLNLGNRLFPVGADDSHSEKNVGGSWIMLGAEALTYEKAIEALEKGDFYASCGPEIHDLYMEGTELYFRCSDVSSVTIESGLRFAAREKAVEPLKLLRSGKIDMKKWFDYCRDGDERNENRTWFRVVFHGPYGDYASTRAFWYDEF